MRELWAHGGRVTMESGTHDSFLGTSLEPERSCIKLLLWRYSLPEHVDVNAFVTRVSQRGWREDEHPVLALSSLTHELGHRLIIVRSTRRVQLRVLYTIPREGRQECARDIGLMLDEVCASVARSAVGS